MSEHFMQCALIEWCHRYKGHYPGIEKIYAVPNGGHRNPATAAMLKAEGVVAGVLDLHLDLARGPYHGLQIELKYGSNVPSDEQWQRLDDLYHDGYLAVVCWDWQDAAQVLEWYMCGCIENLSFTYQNWLKPYTQCKLIRRRKPNDKHNAIAKRGTEHFTAAEYQSHLRGSKDSVPSRPNKRARGLDE